MQYQYKQALVGGTFDRFHPGHKKLLTTTFEQSEKVIVGIATNELFKNKIFSKFIEDYENRKQSVSKFLAAEGFADRAKIVPIHDIYGVSLDSDSFDAIFVTEETHANALKINKERRKKRLEPLHIITVPFVLGNDNKIISSERIRAGEIDREGKSYMKLFTEQEYFTLPQQQREALRRPIGPIYTDMQEVVSLFSSSTMFIAVGDVVSESLLRIDRQADISIIDGMTRREVMRSEYNAVLAKTRTTETKNPPGTITQNAVKTIQKVFTAYETTKEKQLLVVSGEEDLLAIPAILLAPLSSVILYGQFGQGIVVVEVSEQNKQRVHDLFRKFQ